MSHEVQRSERVHNVFDLLIRSVRTHHRSIDRLMADSGLHRGQRMVLSHLSRCKETPSQKEIADQFDISPACVARTLKSLAAEGYITRSGDEDDLRRNNISITDKGLCFVEDTHRAFDEFDQSIFQEFSDEELDQLTGLLSKLHQNLRTAEDALIEKNPTQKGSAPI